MLEYFPIKGIEKDVINKSVILPHPVPDKKFYNIKNIKYDKIDPNKVNIGYFGRFYNKRKPYDILSSFYSLDSELKNQCSIHFFLLGKGKFEKLFNLMPSSNVILNDQLDYLEFLSVLKQFDCLISIDVESDNKYSINPYLPSKMSDYIGSGVDI